MDSKNSKSVPLLRMTVGAALVVAAAVLTLFFDTSGSVGPETARFQGGLAALCEPLLVFGLILLLSWLPARAARRSGRDSDAYRCWRAASGALHSYAMIMAGAGIACTLFLGRISDSMGWTGVLDEDFPRVVINDFHEFAQFALVILIIYYGLALFYLRKKRVASR